MRHYNYTKETLDVFEQLKEVKDARKHEKLYADKYTPEAHKATLRKAYKNALKISLLNLSLALDKWAAAGCRIEEDDMEVD